MPTADNTFDDCWIMYYRHGMNAQLTKNFKFKGALPQARERAEKHCQIMGYKLGFVRPMFPDLTEEELDHVDPQRHRRKLPSNSIVDRLNKATEGAAPEVAGVGVKK